MKIQNAHCVVTGAGRGLGKEIAMELSSLGAIVHACDINDEALSALRNDTDNSVTTFHTCDVSDENNVKKMFAELEKVDVLINNAGIIRDGLLVKVRDGIAKTMPLEDFSGVLNVNLIGVFLCAREASVRMIENGGGVIVNISSVSRSGNFGQTNYSAAKAGVDAMTVVWSKELARHNIRCAAIAPGYINTEMVASINPDALVKITNQVPLKRLGEMSEIAETVRFIIENDFVNGRILEIDGGLRI
ncbi:MAG: SDR family oxidoreductase [Victivallales bacterium]|nr:SDR family oxidoreductase [Victivallales bacterium]